MSASPGRILVLYDSLTGTVEQMARLFAAGAREVSCVEARLREKDAEGPDRAAPAADVVNGRPPHA